MEVFNFVDDPDTNITVSIKGGSLVWLSHEWRPIVINRIDTAVLNTYDVDERVMVEIDKAFYTGWQTESQFALNETYYNYTYRIELGQFTDSDVSSKPLKIWLWYVKHLYISDMDFRTHNFATDWVNPLIYPMATDGIITLIEVERSDWNLYAAWVEGYIDMSLRLNEVTINV